MAKRKHENQIEINFDNEIKFDLLEQHIKKKFSLLTRIEKKSYAREYLSKLDNDRLRFSEYENNRKVYYIVIPIDKYSYFVGNELDYEKLDVINGILVYVKEDKEKTKTLLKYHLQINTISDGKLLLLNYRNYIGQTLIFIDNNESTIHYQETYEKFIDNLTDSKSFHQVIFGSVDNINGYLIQYKQLLMGNNC